MRRPLPVALAACVLLAASLGIAVAHGSTEVELGDVYRILLHRLAGAGQPVDAVDEAVIWQIRMPRALLAMLVGGGLALMGVTMQTLLHNPLAEPYILGLSGGASAGAALFYLGFLPPLLARSLTLPLAAFAGALLALLLVYAAARAGPVLSTARLLLAGVAVASLLGAVTSFLTYASPDPNKLQAVLFWLLGSFAGARWSQLPGAAVAVGAALVGLTAAGRRLDAMLLGEEAARHLGVPVEPLKRMLVLLAAFVTGTLVASAGVVGFVGLIVPHAARFLVGVSHRAVVPVSFAGGALLLLWADLAARTLLPTELPVGILTALCGVPFFLYLLRRSRIEG